MKIDCTIQNYLCTMKLKLFDYYSGDNYDQGYEDGYTDGYLDHDDYQDHDSYDCCDSCECDDFFDV